jgi:ABC-2 type transport system ATP-binding protein
VTSVTAPPDVARSAPIRTEGLSKRYRVRGGSVQAVDGVDLEVRPGEIFGLLGPNGAGKTTTIGMLTTRVVPTAGSAHIDGIDVTAAPARVKQRIGVVPQTNTLDRSLTVAENLYYHARYFAYSRHEGRRRAQALLERFHLADRAGTAVDTLSGGMAQRLMVARALLHDPAVLFLDEPTTGLDPQSRIALWDLLRDFHAAGQTILLTTHYMAEAEHLCDRVAIMDHGQVLALGTPAELRRMVDADTVVHLTIAEDTLGEAAGLADRLRGDGGFLRVDVVAEGLRVHAERSAGVLPQLVMRAEAAGCRVVDATLSAPTLETVFIALTGRDLRE